MKLGEKIKSLRKSKGISQEELAAMLKINRNYLSRNRKIWTNRWDT